ncbi:MAG: hypothetical protein M3352_05220 [Bacteroidota bacterium]|nr:hypothetical protein [Bacteroidota bacterium]
MKEKFIPGIYNYCDRWCERCTFTSRCRNYAHTSKLTPEQLDINNKAFWATISSNFEDAMRLLHKAAEKHGFDFNTPMSAEEEANYKKRESFLKTAAKQHPLSRLCKQYQNLVMPFVEKSEDFTEKTRELVSHLHLGITSEEDVVHTVADIGDCLEIIQWYLFFIDAKLQRALHGKLESEEWETANSYQKDSDGSAKIALIAMERSTGAWVRLYSFLPSSEDTTLQALSLLEQLKQKTIEEFPDAMKFIRPGFDD